MRPVDADERQKMVSNGCIDQWICYRSAAVSAKKLTVLPGREVTITDEAAYGFIMMQGHGSINELPIETPALIRFGELTFDEYFVSEAAAKRGVVIKNNSRSESIVMLKHFGPENPEWCRKFAK